MNHFLQFVLMLVLAPLFAGFIGRTKAFFAGRQGVPLLQRYYDIAKLLQKGAVYSHTTSWIFTFGPLVGLVALLLASLLLPLTNIVAPLAFEGDVVAFIYLFALARIFLVLAAMDTGSSFEGMGASRELLFGIFNEAGFFLALAAMAIKARTLSLSTMFSKLSWMAYSTQGSYLLLTVVALFIIFLAENCRIPIDDPNTHLELTMIHEVMVLDHSGPDLGIIFYTASLKQWILGALILKILLPPSGDPSIDILLSLCGMMALAIFVGVVECVMARLKMNNVPRLLLSASAFSAVSILLALR